MLEPLNYYKNMNIMMNNISPTYYDHANIVVNDASHYPYPPESAPAAVNITNPPARSYMNSTHRGTGNDIYS